jgi:hypothetical protein
MVERPTRREVRVGPSAPSMSSVAWRLRGTIRSPSDECASQEMHRWLNRASQVKSLVDHPIACTRLGSSALAFSGPHESSDSFGDY